MKKNYFVFVIPIVFAALLVITILFNLNSKKNGTNNSQPILQETSQIKDENSNESKTETNPQEISQVSEEIFVDPNRCIGCGKCAKIDSEHFVMVDGISTVKNQLNLNSSALSSAIRSCPADAITLG